MEIEFFYSFVSNCMINGIGLATTYFLYIFLKKFINKKEMSKLKNKKIIKKLK